VITTVRNRKDSSNLANDKQSQDSKGVHHKVFALAYPFEPARHGVGSVAANVRVYDDDGKKRR